MDEHSDVCLSPAAEAEAQAQQSSAVMQEHSVNVEDRSLSSASV